MSDLTRDELHVFLEHCIKAAEELGGKVRLTVYIDDAPPAAVRVRDRIAGFFNDPLCSEFPCDEERGYAVSVGNAYVALMVPQTSEPAEVDSFHVDEERMEGAA